MFQTLIDLLEQKIGLAAETVGHETITKAVERRIIEGGFADGQAYLTYLQTSTKEWEALIESVVVLETWFFRNYKSFNFLGHYVKEEWLPKFREGLLRVLSIPCATGEEPYSIAMTLLEVGLSTAQFHIDAVDISRLALEKAKQGIYGRESFRDKNADWFRERYFEHVPAGYQVHSSVRHLVCFKQGNILDKSLLAEEKPYDLIFCRNLLIYLDKQVKTQVLSHLNNLLTKNGILFVGHAEQSTVCDSAFVPFSQPGVFACRKVNNSNDSDENSLVAQKTLFSGRSSVIGSKSHNTLKSPCPLSTANQNENCLLSNKFLSSSPLLTLKGESSKNSSNSTESHHQITSKNTISHKTKVPIDSPASNSHDENLALIKTAQQLADQGRLDEAFELCEKCLAEQADLIEAHFLMGLIYQALDSMTKAEACFNKTIYLEPNHFEALNHLAVIMEHRGEKDKAKHFRRRMQRIRQKENQS